MSKKKSEFLGSLGIMWQIWKALTDEILAFGGNDEAIRLIETDGDLRRQLAELIIAKMRSAKKVLKKSVEIISKYLESAHDVIVDFNQDLAQMITAGKYNWVNHSINIEHFPIKGSGKVSTRVELLHFNEYFSNDKKVVTKLKKVNEWLASQGANYRYRFARIEELLALGIIKPELQRQFPIAAMGSIWKDTGDFYGRFAYLDRGSRDRDLELCCLEFSFSVHWRFAVVREPIDVVSKYLESSHDVVVDYSQSLAQMIDVGKYNWVNDAITTEHFPIKGSGKVSARVELLHFNESLSNGYKVIAKLKEVNTQLAGHGVIYRYRFARIEELLALGASQSDLQWHFPIAVLESIWIDTDGYRRFAYLDGNDDTHSLCLRCFGPVFHSHWRFAVVREPIETTDVPCE